MHWSRFWDQGYITTFGDSKPENYDGGLRKFWEEKFLELPIGAHILDIAAGNGAIATIAAEISQDHDRAFFVAATDLADIHAELIGGEKTKEARKRIEFHGRTPCERQPFDDNYFNLVTSQFGFEYSDIGKTLREVRRLLMKDGKFIAVSHHTESVLIKTARLERDIYALALDELNLFAASRRYFKELGELDGDSEQLAKVLERVSPLSRQFNATMDKFRQRYGEDERAQFIVGTISYIARTATQTTLDDRLNALKQAQSDCELHRARLDDMVNAALDRERIETLAISAREAGFESVHCLDLFGDDKALAGWQIHLR